VRERIAQVGGVMIRDFMTDQHRHFFPRLPMILVGSLDAHGRPWASLLVGRPGFVHSPDPRTLRVDARPLPGDPLAAPLAVGSSIGLLGIELETRRRNRLNGVVTGVDARGFTIAVRQSFGNCPKYIQARAWEWTDGAPPPDTATHERSALSEEAHRLIADADTFFIATAAANASAADAARADGVDVSHRGGTPGFVRVGAAADGASELTVPDFVGNFMFNTLGNLVVNPRAGLLFVDFARGDLLGLTGAVTIVWNGPEVEAFAGAQRLLRIRIEEGWRAHQALPLRWSAPELSPHLDGLGPWEPASR
jgi:predicted pyridoxine 5'-phosphate oxidase superfamily flavin-nucleotide-binding protein